MENKKIIKVFWTLYIVLVLVVASMFTFGYFDYEKDFETIYFFDSNLWSAMDVPLIEDKIEHIGYEHDSIVQEYVDYAYMISNGDLKFVAMLDCENGRWDYTRKSDYENSLGFCQMNMQRYSRFILDPKFKTDRKRQMQKCWELYDGGTKFSCKKKIWKTIDRFIIF